MKLKFRKFIREFYTKTEFYAPENDPYEWERLRAIFTTFCMMFETDQRENFLLLRELYANCINVKAYKTWEEFRNFMMEFLEV